MNQIHEVKLISVKIDNSLNPKSIRTLNAFYIKFNYLRQFFYVKFVRTFYIFTSIIKST